MRICALRPRSPLLRIPWLMIWGPVSLLCAFFPLAIINFLQFPSLLLLPFSRSAFDHYNRIAAFLIWGWWAWAIQNLIGVRMTVLGDAIPQREDAIVIANHQSMADIAVILCLAFAKGRVADTKWMVKDILKYVPGIGWGLLFLGALFLKRDWATDEENIRKTFRRYAEGKLPLWLVSFPEGTRLTPKKLSLSQAYAKKAGLVATSYVLLPRPSGFIASVEGLRQRVHAVYSLTIKYPGDTPPSLSGLIRGEIDAVQLHVTRIPIAHVATDTKDLAGWLLTEFYAKDKRLQEASAIGFT